LPGARAHVGQDHRQTIRELVNEGVKTGGRVDVHFRHLTTKEVRQQPARLIFSVKVEQLDRKAILLEPLRQTGHYACFSDSALATHR
jgi:hypothetical protein